MSHVIHVNESWHTYAWCWACVPRSRPYEADCTSELCSSTSRRGSGTLCKISHKSDVLPFCSVPLVGSWLLRNVYLGCDWRENSQVCRTWHNYHGTAPQHTAPHCTTLQHTATHCHTLPHTASHCNTLQHTATHCNTLQHALRHWMCTFGATGVEGPLEITRTSGCKQTCFCEVSTFDTLLLVIRVLPATIVCIITIMW